MRKTPTQKRKILELLSAPGRYIMSKVKSIYKKLMKKEPKKPAKILNILEKEVNEAEMLQRKSIDELKEIARLKRIKNEHKLRKEGLIISLLKSESSNAEFTYIKHFNNNTDDGADKIRGKIRDIKMILTRLGNIVTNKDRKKITKELYEIEKKQNLSDKEKEKIYDDCAELVRTVDKKREYKYHDRDKLDYHGIRDVENVNDVNDDNDYKPILVRSSFKNNYKCYESRGDKDKKLSVNQYLYIIMSYLSDMINDHNAIRNESREWKVQLNIHVNFISSNDTEETRAIYVWSDNQEIRLGNETDDIIKGLLCSFLNNYQ